MHFKTIFLFLSCIASYLLVKCPESRYSSPIYGFMGDIVEIYSCILWYCRVSCSCSEQTSLVACSSGETVTSSSSSSNSSPRTQRKDMRKKTERRPAVKPPEPPEEPPPHIPVKGKVILRGQAATLVKLFWPCQSQHPPITGAPTVDMTY